MNIFLQMSDVVSERCNELMAAAWKSLDSEPQLNTAGIYATAVADPGGGGQGGHGPPPLSQIRTISYAPLGTF